MEIRFTVATESSINKKNPRNPKTLYVDDSFPKDLLGEYMIRQLNAQEALDTENQFILEHKEAQDNPDRISPDSFTQKLIEEATTINGTKLKLPDLKTVPRRYYNLLVAAFERLNGISNAEAVFLLQPS